MLPGLAITPAARARPHPVMARGKEGLLRPRPASATDAQKVEVKGSAGGLLATLFGVLALTGRQRVSGIVPVTVLLTTVVKPRRARAVGR